MNILQVHKYYRYKDGATNYMLQLSDWLEKQGDTVIPFSMKDKNNINSPYSIYFVSPMDIHNPKKLSLAKKIQYAGRMIYSLEAKRRMKELLDRHDIDIVHVHNMYHHISPSILREIKKRGIPIVMTLHDYKLIAPNYSLFHHGKVHEEDATGWYGTCVKNKCMQDSKLYSRLLQIEMIIHHKLFKFYERYVDMCFAPSQFMHDLCIKHGWNPEKIMYLPNGVDMSQYKQTKKGGKTVAYIGRLSEEKGIEVLLHAAAATPDIPYVIVGSGPQEKQLKQLATSLQLQNVQFTGFLTGDALKRQQQQARIMVSPSIWYENAPLSILEPMAMGKIVLGSAIGGIPELLPKMLQFPAGDAKRLAKVIKKWYDAPSAKRKRVGTTLRKSIEKKYQFKDRVGDIYDQYMQYIAQYR